MGDVEHEVQAVILERVIEPGLIREFLTRFNEWLTVESGTVERGTQERQAEASRLEQELSNLVAAVAAGGGRVQSLVAEIKRREARLETLRGEIASMSFSANRKIHILEWSNDDLEPWVESVRAVYLGMDDDGKRAVLRHLIKKVVIEKNKEGRVVYDPAALVSLRQAVPGMPEEDPVRIKNGCGGPNWTVEKPQRRK